MGDTLNERRMVENEVVFRQYNERVLKGFDEIKRIAREDGQEAEVSEDDTPLQFYCECSDENCRQRVRLKPSNYAEIHKYRDRFVIICGHDNKAIEEVIAKENDFCIVEKFNEPPATVSGLNKTQNR